MSSLPSLTTIANGNPADATEVDGNFTTLGTFVDEELINRDGSVAMTAELTLSSSTPSSALVAASKGYVDSVSSGGNNALFTRSGGISVNDGVSGTVTFESESNDLDGWWAVGTPTVFTCPTAGQYAISLRGEKSAGSGSVTFVIDASGTNSMSSLQATTGAGTTDYGVNGAVFFLRAGDSFTVTYSNTSGASATITNVYVSITKLAET